MNKKGLFRFVISAIRDPERDFSERVYLTLAIISEVTVFLALIGDIATGENIHEIIVLISVLVFVPTLSLICLKKEKLKFGIRFILCCLVLLILPALFFFGGGVEGGGVIWVIFSFLFVGLVLSGTWRNAILFLLVLVTTACYLIQYFHPEFVYQHSRKIFFIDSYLSIILVGIVCFVVTWFQNRLFKLENARARKEAERAEELTRAQNRFFSSMSHEIRTPINSILGLNELILREHSASEEIVRDATGIQGSGKMLLALINDILDFSKMEAGSMDIVSADYRVSDMISEVVNMFWLNAHEKGLGFDVNVDPKVPSVLYGDEVRIKQIIINILNNAVKYTTEGSVGLRMESEDLSEDRVLMRITVSDTGMGIKKESLPYLFDAFKRVDEGKNKYIEGTGLGLSIVKQLVELMGGTITVDSVYGEGSTFIVSIPQTVSDRSELGEVSIHNQRVASHGAYESSFKAPSAKVLIVDDNEMNLEVESKLLAETGMQITTVTGGREALALCVRKKYDVILMDHLMPGMDGIECLKAIRNQTGGLNRATPIIVLTANAGSENKELYNSSGFDGYLIKPVSGEKLEETMLRHISPDKIKVSGKTTRMRMDVDMTSGYARKLPVIITSSSMCDLPDEMIRRLSIPIIPFVITTEKGEFKDGLQLSADELVRYIAGGGKASSSPPDVQDYTEFFANALKRAHHLIHISITTSMSDDYQRALEAAKSFDNVIVVNSETLSSATGILVLIAYRLAQQGVSADNIVSELDRLKSRLRCSFVIDNTEYMARKGLITAKTHKIAKALSLHPSLKIMDDKSSIGNVSFGSTKRAYKRYIKKAFPVDIIPDSDIAFITYADMPEETLNWIKEEVSKIVYFERIVFMQTSAAISSNCGPGTFGILYFVKSNKSYNIGSYVKEEEEDAALEDFRQSEIVNGAVIDTLSSELKSAVKTEKKEWYHHLEGIDGELAIENSGSEKAFLSVLKLFYDAIPEKTAELNGYYASEDLENYTIKIHALKSSAKLVGAMELSKMAQELEYAGKRSDMKFIKDNHGAAMMALERYREILREYCGSGKGEIQDDSKPVADNSIMEGVYEAFKEAAEAFDCDAIDAIFKEMEDYSIPESDKEKYYGIKEKAGKFDYEGILELLK